MVHASEFDERMMGRALELARRGEQYASPNPMVGVVITGPDGRIIGEGYHRICGQAHAEVNAVNSVADRSLLKESTIYVTLEPCAHHGRTPPCAALIVECGFKRVVVGTVDPFSKVSGRGIAMIREAGIEVTVGVLEQQCRELNYRFITAHTHGRPKVTLKWAQSADGYLDAVRSRPGDGAYRFSNELTTMLNMRQRSLHDVILTTSATVLADNPRLNVRGWEGREPQVAVLDRHNRLAESECHVTDRDDTIIYNKGESVADALRDLYSRGASSVLVEAGPMLLGEMISQGLWDEARVEISPVKLGDLGVKPAPMIEGELRSDEIIGGNRVMVWRATSA